MRRIKVAAVQMCCSPDIKANITKAEQFVHKAASQGAQIILLQELFETLYFCQQKTDRFLAYATEIERNPAIERFKKIAQELQVVVPISFFEKTGTGFFNSVAIIDADGRILGSYRKTHIPDGPGYEEKYYFQPGDTGFKVWQTRYATIGVGICWDQWFPEAARCMALQGAELLFYPTAIGSEPNQPGVDSKQHWQNCMRGHAAANVMPVIAANRTGKEVVDDSSITFYGSSFIADQTGELMAAADRDSETVISAVFDLDELERFRNYWGVFKDRRPEMYGLISAVTRP